MVNLALNDCSSRYICLLNNDIWLIKGWLTELVKTLDKHEEVAAVGAKLLYPDDTIQHAGVYLSPENYPDHIGRGKPREEFSEIREMIAVTFACALLGKEAIPEGGMDEGYEFLYEDTDLCFQMRKNGWKIIYNPKSVAYHREGKTLEKLKDRETIQMRSLRRFLEKWNDWIALDRYMNPQLYEEGIPFKEVE